MDCFGMHWQVFYSCRLRENDPLAVTGLRAVW
jgi:hypothetical protein